MKSYRLIFIFFAIILLFSCKKDESSNNIDLLVYDKWKLVEKQANGNIITTDCHKDNILDLHPDFTYSNRYGNNICESEMKYLKGKGNWTYIENKNRLIFTYIYEEDYSTISNYEFWEIIKLTPDSLIISNKDVETVHGNPVILQKYVRY